MDKKKLVRRKASEWEDHVRRQGECEKSVEEYCRAQHLGEASFYQWRRRLNGRHKEKRDGFIEVTDFGLGTGTVLRVITPSGYKLEIGRGVKAEEVKALLQSLARI